MRSTVRPTYSSYQGGFPSPQRASPLARREDGAALSPAPSRSPSPMPTGALSPAQSRSASPMPAAYRCEAVQRVNSYTRPPQSQPRSGEAQPLQPQVPQGPQQRAYSPQPLQGAVTRAAFGASPAPQ